jgi:hypothetical protein
VAHAAIIASLIKQDADDGSPTTVSSASSSLVASDQTISLSPLTETIAAGSSYCIQVQFALSPSGQRVYGARVVYDRVA